MDFSITDIIMPKPSKTKIFLSWLIPYFYMVRERREYVDDVLRDMVIFYIIQNFVLFRMSAATN